MPSGMSAAELRLDWDAEYGSADALCTLLIVSLPM